MHRDEIHDDTDGIQGLLDSGISCVYLPPGKEYLISRPLLLHSRQSLRLDPYTIIRLMPQEGQKYSAMIANADQINGNEFISVSGGIWDMDNMHQPPNPVNLGGIRLFPQRHLPHPIFDRAYVRAIMHFFNVRHLVLKDLVLKNAPFHHIRLGRVSNFTVSDITLDTQHAPLNDNAVDGIGFYDGDCRWGVISNIRGRTIDDFISFNPDCGVISMHRGPIEHIFIHDIIADQAHAGIRLLSSGSPIRDIKISNFHITSNGKVLQLSNFKTFCDMYPEEKHGIFENITMENVTASCSEKNYFQGQPEARSMIWVEGGSRVTNLRLHNICRTEEKSATELIYIDRGAEVEHLEVSGVFCTNKTGHHLPVIANRGHIKMLKLDDLVISCHPEAWGTALINTGTIEDCQLGKIRSECANRNLIYQTDDLPPGIKDKNTFYDFPAHWYGFHYADTVQLSEDKNGLPVLVIRDQITPYPLTIASYAGSNETPEKTISEQSGYPAENPMQSGAYNWVDCGEQMLFYYGKRVALCLGGRVPAYRRNELASTHEIEFSIAPYCRNPALPQGLYRIWAKIKTEKQTDGKHTIFLHRVALVRNPLPVKGELSLSGEWTVFTPFEMADPLPSKNELRHLPKILRSGDKEAVPKRLKAPFGLVDFSQIWGKVCAGRIAYVYIPFRVDHAGEYTFGFGADWWYQAWIDGNAISDTLACGNGRGQASCLDHLANTYIEAGAHLLAVRFISGKGESVLYVGGPTEIRAQNETRKFNKKR